MRNLIYKLSGFFEEYLIVMLFGILFFCIGVNTKTIELIFVGAGIFAFFALTAIIAAIINDKMNENEEK